MPDARQEEIDDLANKVEGWPEVASVDHVSEEAGARELQGHVQGPARPLRGPRPGRAARVGPDPAQDPGAANDVAERLKQEGFTEDNLSYPQQTIERLNAVTSYMIWGLYGATLLFLVASVLLISNAIRLSIFARRKEIEVMKLVGASDGFVRTPFVFEGLVQGLVGAGLAALAVVWINFLFVDWSHDALPFVPISAPP